MTRLIEAGLLDANVAEELDINEMKRLEFGLGFTPGPAVSLLLVGVRKPGQLWKMVLGSPVVDTDGEIRCSLGSYPSGTVIQVRFDVTPISGDVPRLAVGVIQENVLSKARERTGLGRMEEWGDKFEYTVR